MSDVYFLQSPTPMYFETGTWGNMSIAVSNASGTPTLFQAFSGTCLYFALALTEQLGTAAPPIGLIQTAIGGSQIEAWMYDEHFGDELCSKGHSVVDSYCTAFPLAQRVTQLALVAGCIGIGVLE